MEDVVIKILPDFTIWKLHSFKEILLFFLVVNCKLNLNNYNQETHSIA